LIDIPDEPVECFQSVIVNQANQAVVFPLMNDHSIFLVKVCVDFVGIDKGIKVCQGDAGCGGDLVEAEIHEEILIDIEINRSCLMCFAENLIYIHDLLLCFWTDKNRRIFVIEK
jgi:hypothetical protein